MPEIRSWQQVYIALRSRAMESRGFIELNPNTSTAVRWPRTTGLDVIAIAAVIDPAVRAQASRADGHGVAARWRASVHEIVEIAPIIPDETYPDNRAFWHTLASVCAYLATARAQPPAPALVDGLLRQLAAERRRNRGPSGRAPFQQTDVSSFHDVYIEQYKHLRAVRGTDRMAPEPGMRGIEFDVPRTTNADVVALADYWTKQVNRARRINGDKGIYERWKAATAEVDEIARKGEPMAVYPKNNGFWRALGKAAAQVATADEAPTTADFLLESLGENLRKLPGRVADAVGSVASGAGKVADRAASGLLAGLRTPLIVGGVGLGVVALLLFRRSSGKGA